MDQRRSRMHRTRTGKSLALTARDLEIFRALRRYRFLRSTYLHAFVGGDSEKRFKERLGDLFHEGYLDRPAEQWRFADARFAPVVHKIGKGAIVWGGLPAEADAVTWLRDGAHRQFQHTLMICEVLASIELTMRGRDDLRFVPWPEILGKAPQRTRESERPYVLTTSDGRSTVVPDALFGIVYNRDKRPTYRFFALEADRGTMPVARTDRAGTSVLAKLAAYRDILAENIYRSRLGIPNLLVLTVTTDHSRCNEIIGRLSKAGEAAQFLFRSAGSSALATPCGALLTDAWMRPGLPDLTISGHAG
jgi:hypothetical protein